MNRNHANFPSETSNYPAPLKSKKLQDRQAAQWEAAREADRKREAQMDAAADAYEASKR